jgi:hypothetical protein
MDAIVQPRHAGPVPPDAGKRKGTRPGCDGGRYAFMRRVLDTDRGDGLHAKRQGMIEVFADTEFNRRCDPSNAAVHPRPGRRSQWPANRRNAQPAEAFWRHTSPPMAA